MIRITPKTLCLISFLISLVSRAQSSISVIENGILIEKTIEALNRRLSREIVEPGQTFAEQLARGQILHEIIGGVSRGRYPKNHVISMLLERGYRVEAEMYAEIEGLTEVLVAIDRIQTLRDQKSRDDLRIGYAK